PNVEPVQPKRIATKGNSPRRFMAQIYGAKRTLPRIIRAACSCGQRATELAGLNRALSFRSSEFLRFTGNVPHVRQSERNVTSNNSNQTLERRIWTAPRKQPASPGGGFVTY